MLLNILITFLFYKNTAFKASRKIYESPKYLSYLKAWKIGITEVPILFSTQNILITQVTLLFRSMENRNHPSTFPI